jgi:hypothetical protein
MGSVVRKITRPVKKVVKTVEKVAKSPVGKAALIGAIGFGIPTTQFGGLFGRAGVPGLFGTEGIGQAFTRFMGGKLDPLDVLGGEMTTGKQNLFRELLGKGLGAGSKVLESIPGGGTTVAGLAALSGLLAVEDRKSEEEIANMTMEERNRYVAKLRAAYTANLAGGFPGIGSVPYAMAAEGGRVGMAVGGIMRLKKLLDEAYDMVTSRVDFDFSDYKMRGQLMAEELSELKFGKDYYDLDQKTQMDLYKQSSDYLDDVAADAADNARDIMKERFDKAEGGMPTGIMRTNAAGIKERDYRDEGGFVPVGIKEKADDVPAMLSKNEFVMTADAVRGAGDGSIEKGAQKMYDTMKKLEDKVA